VAPGDQARGDAGRGVQQIARCEGACSGDDGRPVTVPPRPCDEGQLAQGRASITSRTLRASAPSENGFCRKATPSSRTPCCRIASSVYPDRYSVLLVGRTCVRL